MLAEMSSKKIVASLALLAIAGAIGIAARKAEAHLTVVSATQYAYVDGDPDLCTSYTIPLDTLITEDGVYVSYLIHNERWYSQYERCMAILRLRPELHKYNPETGELIWEFAAEFPPPVGNITALTIDSGGNVWGLVPDMGVFPTQYILLKIDPTTGAEITRIVISVSGYDIKLFDVAADPADPTSLYVCGSAADGDAPTSFVARINSTNGDISWTAFPGGQRISIIVVAADFVACAAHADDAAKDIVVLDAAVGDVKWFAALRMNIKDVGTWKQDDWPLVVAAGDKRDEYGQHCCVAAMDVDTEQVYEVVFDGPGDGGILGVSLAPNATEVEITAAGYSSVDDTETTQGLLAKLVVKRVDLKQIDLRLIGTYALSAEELDVRFKRGAPWDLTYMTVCGTVAGGALPVGEYHGADEESFVAILYDPVAAIEALIAKVEGMNLHQGIDNSLDAKLENAKNSLESVKAGNRQDAVNKLQAFINECEAQSGNKLSPDEAADLIADAQEIIDALQQ